MHVYMYMHDLIVDMYFINIHPASHKSIYGEPVAYRAPLPVSGQEEVWKTFQH